MKRSDQHQPKHHPGEANLRAQLLTMADRLDHDPDQPADLTLTPATQLEVANDVSPDFIDLLPQVTRPTTRGAYAARLRQIAGVR